MFLNIFISHTAKLQEERIYVCGPASFRWPTSHQMPIRYEASNDPTTDKDLQVGSVLSAAMLERALFTVLGEEYRTDGVRQDRVAMRRAVENLAADALLRIARLSTRNAPFTTHTTSRSHLGMSLSRVRLNVGRNATLLSSITTLRMSRDRSLST